MRWLLIILLIPAFLFASVTVSIPDTSMEQGLEYCLPVYIHSVQADSQIFSIELSLDWNVDIFRFLDISVSGTRLELWGNPVFSSTDSCLTIWASGAQSITESGIMFFLRFKVEDQSPVDTTSISISKFYVNEGFPRTKITEPSILILPWDIIPPSQITDLAFGEVGPDFVKLKWTVPGDDYVVGTAVEYDVRYSTHLINDANWESCTEALSTPVPKIAGQLEEYIITGLNSSIHYYFGIKTIDDRDNISSISNIVDTVTVDVIPPSLKIVYPEPESIIAAGTLDTVRWISSDLSGIRNCVVYFRFYETDDFALIDSVLGTADSLYALQWAVPNIVSAMCQVEIVVEDSVGLVCVDTVGFFSIVDNTPPEIAILAPTAGFTVPENHLLTVRWLATDNIQMDSVSIYYARIPTESYLKIGEVPADSSQFTFNIPSGISNHATIRLIVEDIYNNQSEAISAEFRVIDITPPEVALITTFTGQHFETFQSVNITWTATDNAGVQFIDIDYSVNGGTNWTPIAANESNDGSYDWLIPDEQSENCKIRVIATDGVGLSDTSISEGAFTIVRIYPKLAAFPSILSPLDTLVLEFTQAMDSAGFSNGCVLHSRTLGDLIYHYRFYDNLRKAKLYLTESFTSRDTLSVLLTANSTTNIYGYGIDGNANGVFDGSPTDNLTLTIPVEIAGDFNNDDVVNFDDFAPFVLAWQGRDYGKELSPNRGEVPKITISPNQKYDIYDLTTFASLWNWTVGLSKALPRLADFPEVDFSVTQEGNSVTVKPNGSNVIAYQYIVEYNPKVVAVKSADNRLARITETQMRMVDAFPDSGRLLISEGYFSASVLPEMHLKLSPKGRNSYEITIAYQTVLTDCTRVMGKRTIRLQPIPTKFALQQNYPNPFNPTTTIPYQLPEKEYVRISIYNLNGQLVETIVSKEQPAGYYSVVWNSSKVSSGIYIYRIDAGSFHDVKKCVILK